MRNHLKWARIRINGDGADIPKEVTIDGGGICYAMQIWVESPVRVFAEEDRTQGRYINGQRGGKPAGVQELVEGGMQIQQIHDVEPVSIQNLGYHTDGEIEASSWVKSHILELSKTYGVAFESFREETHALLMKLDEKKSVMEKKGANSVVSTPRHRGIGKNELKNLQSDLNEEVEGERNRGRVLSLTLK
ncbi:hypothetical protein H5410_043699 [Solanum commersonii]|uniref:Uncharacterized protein n=1 Tax=Solanum commersonii TaxID=4109 RepID=A0A9J5XYA6_SOLCO|nr:hypothetical protein H5410_043699 [Solanum commersonii]